MKPPIQYGIKIVFGIPSDMKPIEGLPEGRRKDCFMAGRVAYIGMLTANGLKLFALEDAGDK
jgi:hypothetical protein